LNAGGGDLLIGVDDDGNILGIADDLAVAGNKDKLVQNIESVFGKTLSPNPLGLVHMGFVDIDGKTICRVRVQGDNANLYKFKENVYVRRNSGSKPALTVEDAARWWPRRQRGEE
jgi:predicted HTH transcriptional regulator